AIDLRIGLPEAATLRAPAARYSLWPDDPFGASADYNVWPSAFTQRDQARADRILLDPGEAPYWDSFYMWYDVREMTNHMRPLPITTNVIALGLDRDPTVHLRRDYALGQLKLGKLTPETLEMEAAFMGYDITDEFLRSALFDSARPDFDASNVSRTAYGLVDTLPAARTLRDLLDKDDPAHSPLSCISVWSLGERPPTPPAQ
uniref:hypothetical protein n=1 Tax=Roseobacter weihaiensis TaxID=2763262 RepID=UPI001D09D8CE